MAGMEREIGIECRTFRTRLLVAGNGSLIMKTCHAFDQMRLEPGQEIEIGWPPEECRALDAA